MPDTKKKTMVKVAKKSNPESEEDKKGIIDTETTADAKAEGYVPKGLTKEIIKKIDNTTEVNKNRRDVESMAKSDSILGAKKAKFDGKDLIDQARAGNKAANETRVKGGVPQVMRGREYTGSSYPGGDKYSQNFDNTKDIYNRTAPLEKEMPVPKKKVMVKVVKK